jgi:hypothetical protein
MSLQKTRGGSSSGISSKASVCSVVDSHVNKLEQLEAARITQFNIYLDNEDEEGLIADYAEKVIPAIKR